MASAIVVGSGPNGLAGAVELARAGLDVTVLEGHDTIGGGTRTVELTVPGVLHDVCSAVHPLGVGSPYLRSLPLEEHGLQWARPPVGVAHPLDAGTAASEGATLAETAAGLGRDGPTWRRLLEPLVEDLEPLLDDVLGPMLGVPGHPVTLARFGLRAMQPATWVARWFRTDAARALFGGGAAHAIHPLTRPTTAAAGLVLLAAGQRFGWQVAVGGSAAITSALASLLEAHGGRIETGVWVHSLQDLPPADVVLLDVAPGAVVDLAGEAVAPRARRSFSRWRHGPGAFKVDLAVEGGIPWTAEVCRRAGTVHVGGRLEELVDAERDVHDGRMPQRPFVLVAQQYLADPSRSAGDVHPVWTYCHVPNGWPGDATEHILRQLERFAPGTRERIVGMHTTSAPEFAAYNPNFVGGDIATGANDPIQAVLRPRVSLRPYATTVPGVYLCSAATPPGAGVHGMCGHHAARAALADLA